MNIKKSLFAVAMLAVAAGAHAQGKINVVTSTEDLASIAP